MRGIGLGAIAVPAALIAAAPAAARDVAYNGTLHVSGGVTISWHGDPARGCAPAGLCGYSGFLNIQPSESEYNFLVNGRGHPIDGYGSLDLFDSPPQVRVKRTEAGGDQGGCVDTSPIELVDVRVSRAGGRRVRLGLSAYGLDTGRCAGPRLPNLLTRLPRRTRSVSKLVRGGAAVDFSGSFPYAQGRFSGTVRSNLRVTFAKPAPDVVTPPSRPPRPPHRPRVVRVVRLHAIYRVNALTGSLATQFAGIADPGCADFDACGVDGSSSWQVAANGGTFSFYGEALARRKDHGVRGALAAIRRPNGFVSGYSHLGNDPGTVTADVSRSGGERCRDTARVAWSAVAAANEGARLVFEFGGEDEVGMPPSGALRTGCPGPRDQDVVGFNTAGHGSVPLTALGRRSFGVRVSGSGRFSGHGYAGTRTAELTMGLQRVSLRAVYGRARGNR
jgi:hypothetical protein